MKTLIQVLSSSLSRRINALIRRAEAVYPDMEDVAAMVYVGDVYALREQHQRRSADGWGRYRYTCDSGRCLRLP